MGWKHILSRPPLAASKCRNLQTGRFCGKFTFYLDTSMLSANAREIGSGASAGFWHSPCKWLELKENSGN